MTGISVIKAFPHVSVEDMYNILRNNQPHRLNKVREVCVEWSRRFDIKCFQYYKVVSYGDLSVYKLLCEPLIDKQEILRIGKEINIGVLSVTDYEPIDGFMKFAKKKLRYYSIFGMSGLMMIHSVKSAFPYIIMRITGKDLLSKEYDDHTMK